jgi:hypothetical protein
MNAVTHSFEVAASQLIARAFHCTPGGSTQMEIQS